MLAGHKRLYWWIRGNQFVLLRDEQSKVTLIYGAKPSEQETPAGKEKRMGLALEPFLLWEFGMTIDETMISAGENNIRLEALRLPFLLSCVEDWVHDQKSPVHRSFLEGPLAPCNN
jgi:hypothetical protein